MYTEYAVLLLLRWLLAPLRLLLWPVQYWFFTQRVYSTGAIIVTGASRGIGLGIARALAAEGFTVFAGVRTSTAAATLARVAPELRPLTLDVAVRWDSIRMRRVFLYVVARTHRMRLRWRRRWRRYSSTASRWWPSSITRAWRGCRRLSSFPNSTLKCVKPGCCLWRICLRVLHCRPQSMLDVNLRGIDRMVKVHDGRVCVWARVCVLPPSQSTMPLLRESGGRIVIIGSMAGIRSVFVNGMYCASKFAVEGYAEALRLVRARMSSSSS